MVGVKIYVEGGGDHGALVSECRRAFGKFLEKLEGDPFKGKRPAFIASGSRLQAYKDFCTALSRGEVAYLLVDAECEVKEGCQEGNPESWKPWRHLSLRDGDKWNTPAGSTDLHCHLMAQLMESWFLADREGMARYFGKGFSADRLPARTGSIELVEKSKVMSGISDAIKDCGKGKCEYRKGKHSFALLEQINSEAVIAASPWARRFVDEIKRAMCVESR